MDDLRVSVTIDGRAVALSNLHDLSTMAVKDCINRLSHEIQKYAMDVLQEMRDDKTIRKRIEDFHVQEFFRALVDQWKTEQENIKLRQEVRRLTDLVSHQQ